MKHRQKSVFVLGLCLCASAGAQTAGGDGHALDANLGTHYGRRNTPVRDFAAEARLRDAIVTGTAGNGLSFRGDLGYQSADEFRAELGSNDLYSFRRDALSGGLGGYGIRGVDALQYQFALQTGAKPPSSLRGGVSVARFGGAAGSPGLEVNPERDEEFSAGLALSPIRSGSAYSSTRSLTPSLLALQPTAEGAVYGVTASPLLGVQVKEYPGGTGEAEEAPVYGDVYRQFRERFVSAVPQPGVEAGPTWEQRVAEIMARFEAENAEIDEAADASQETLDMIRAASGTPISEYVAPTPTGDASQYERYMRMGQATLSSGMYFDSEEWFTFALSSKSGDPMAMMGRVHAQIGAGMFLSAATNLRELYRQHPEMIGATFEPGLLPPAARRAEVVAAIRKQLSGPVGSGAHGALVLAYLARQSGDAGLTAEALVAADRLGGDPALLSLLRGVWLPEREPRHP